MEVFTDSGHNIQEDVPEKLAAVILEFLRRNRGGVGEIKRFPIAGRVKSGATRPE